jgi:hypothetical protein
MPKRLCVRFNNPKEITLQMRVDAQPARLGRRLERVEDVADGDAQGDVLNHVVLDELTEEMGRQGELLVRVRREEALLLVEHREDVGEEARAARVAVGPGLVEEADDVLDGRLALVELAEERVAAGLDVGIEREPGGARLAVAAGDKVHETRVELEGGLADVLEDLGVFLGEGVGAVRRFQLRAQARA